MSSQDLHPMEDDPFLCYERFRSTYARNRVNRLTLELALDGVSTRIHPATPATDADIEVSPSLSVQVTDTGEMLIWKRSAETLDCVSSTRSVLACVGKLLTILEGGTR